MGESPEWVEQIRDEFDAVGQTINSGTLKQLPKTEAFIKETLRISHIVEFYIPRTLTKDVVLPNGDTMPAGLEFVIDFAMMMRNPETFENPLKFNPTRFLTNKDYDSYLYTPFAAGRRNCIGQVFAMQEMKIALLRMASLVSVQNSIVIRDPKTNRPPNKQLGATFKVKPNSLEQQFLFRK